MNLVQFIDFLKRNDIYDEMIIELRFPDNRIERTAFCICDQGWESFFNDIVEGEYYMDIIVVGYKLIDDVDNLTLL